MIVRDKDTQITAEVVKGAIAEFVADVLPRLNTLADAYKGKTPITKRVRASGLPNNKLVHAYPRYIVTMASGYLVGAPVKYSDEKQKDAIKALEEAHKHSKIDSVDAELAEHASIYGRGVCICYTDEEGKPKAAALNPREAFVVYDDTVEHRPLFGVHWMDKFDVAGKKTGVTVHVHSGTEEQLFEGKAVSSLAAVPEETKAHAFGGVPMVEFWNNSDEMGDFEPVLSLIEAYDTLESDRVNDKQQFTDAVLLLTGCTLESGEEEVVEGYDEDGEPITRKDTRTAAQKLLEEKTLTLPDEAAKAEWLIKKSDETGSETLKNAINDDIHKMSMIPDLTDEHFAANASGVAMGYKLLGMEQLTKTKERWFKEGIQSRLRLFANILSVLARATLIPEDVTITFTRSLPVNAPEIAAMVAQLSGIAPQKRLLGQLPFIDDVDKAVKELEEEQEKAAKRQADAFGGQYMDGNDVPKQEDDPKQEKDEPKKRNDDR